MAAGKYNFVIEQGATFERTITFTDSSGDPVDLTDYGARMQIRPTTTSDVYYFNISSTPTSDGTGMVLGGTSGTVALTISAYSSSLVDFNEAFYDLELYSGSGVSEYVIRLMEGNVTLKKNVTR